MRHFIETHFSTPMRREKIWLTLILLATTYTMLTAMRAPNQWSVTQLAWTYHFGFIRRALTGQVLTGIFGFLTYHFLSYLSFIILFAEIGLMIVWCRHLYRKLPASGLLLLTFFTSPALLFLTHIVGYLDHLLLLITLAIAVMPATGRNMIGIALLCMLGLLVHELFAVIVTPVLIIRALMAWQSPGRGKAQAIDFASVIAFTLVITFLLDLPPKMTGEGLKAFTQDTARHVDFPLNPINIAVLGWDYKDSLGRLRDLYGNVYNIFSQYGVAYMPSWLLYWAIVSWIFIKTYGPFKPAQYAIIVPALSAALLMPIGTMCMAWDYGRFFCQDATVSFLIFLTLIHHSPNQLIPKLNTPFWGLMALGVILFNFNVPPVLMDDRATILFLSCCTGNIWMMFIMGAHPF